MTKPYEAIHRARAELKDELAYSIDDVVVRGLQIMGDDLEAYKHSLALTAFRKKATDIMNSWPKTPTKERVRQGEMFGDFLEHRILTKVDDGDEILRRLQDLTGKELLAVIEERASRRKPIPKDPLNEFRREIEPFLNEGTTVGEAFEAYKRSVGEADEPTD